MVPALTVRRGDINDDGEARPTHESGAGGERNDWDVGAVYSRLTERAWVRVTAATVPAEVQTSAQ